MLMSPDKELPTKQLAELFKHFDSVIKIIEQNDPNIDRNSTVIREIHSSLPFNKELNTERERKNYGTVYGNKF